MGLIKAGLGSLGGVLADQWKEYIYCDALAANVLVAKGQKQTSSRSSNTKGHDNVITNGSGIMVADGQCMIIVENGKVVEVCAEPGQFTYDNSSAPSIFSGKFGESLVQTFKNIGKRFTFGGAVGGDQRVYYINTKEMIDNKFGSQNPIPFRVVDKNIGLDLDTAVRCSGVYSYRISDPLNFYVNLTGNVAESYTREDLDGQLKTEFITALQPAFAKLSALGMRPSEIPGHAEELCEAMNEALDKKWGELRGLEVVSVGVNPLILPDEDAQMIKEAQKSAIMRDPSMAAAQLVGAQADAMRSAANNQGGAMTGFMGMGMAMNQGGMNAQTLFEMGQKNQAQTAQNATWQCKCGNTVNGNFCSNCGSANPNAVWTCSCGNENKGNFCSNCGSKRPL